MPSRIITVGSIGGGFTEQGDVGPKLEIVRRSENFQRRLALVTYCEAHIMAQAVAKYWVTQIASSLIHILDGISLSHGAMTQTRQLWKDEPHPVGPLVSISQLLNDLAIDLSLGVHKPNEISFGLSHR